MFSKHRDALAAMLYLDTWRGRDSTGVAAIRHNADTDILKSTVPGYEFVEGPKLEQHLKLNDFLWIGHNRAGTIGKNIKTNAHPFSIDDEDGCCLIVGAHNGTLKNKHVLTDHVQFGTDSEALFNEIALNGIEDTIAKVEGAWALTYYDHIEEELRFIRNKERPLFYAFEEGRKTLFWASEMWMLKVATSRAGIKLLDDKIHSFAEDTLYKFPAPLKMNEELTFTRQGGLVGKTSAFFQGRRDWKSWGSSQQETGGGHGQRALTETKKETPPANQSRKPPLSLPNNGIAVSSSTQSSTQTNASGEKQTKPKGSSSNTRSKGKQPDDKVVSINTAKTFKGYGGEPLTRAELQDQLSNGCSWCELEFIDILDRFAWLAPSKPVCSKCIDGSHEEQNEVTPSSITVH